jgi:hypothetical protein
LLFAKILAGLMCLIYHKNGEASQRSYEQSGTSLADEPQTQFLGHMERHWGHWGQASLVTGKMLTRHPSSSTGIGDGIGDRVSMHKLLQRK